MQKLTFLLKTVFTLFIFLLSSAAFAQQGANDPSFNPTDIGFGSGNGTNGQVNRSFVQADGKIIITGYFTTYNSTSRNRIARLNTDGSLDVTFNPGTGANDSIFATAVQNDGKIIIGGNFTDYNGTPVTRIARVNTDGTIDPTFITGTGANASIFTVSVQSDGKIVAGGRFTTYNGIAKNRITRLNADGTPDATFIPGAGANDFIFCTTIQSDGKILIGGRFTNYNVTARNRIARLNADGTLDAGFDPGTGADDDVAAITVQSDGKILTGGSFSNYNGFARNSMARLNPNGSIDAGFNQGTGSNRAIYFFVIQSDGKILVGGILTLYNGTPRFYIARLNADGTLDAAFNPYPGEQFERTVNTINIQSDGKIFIGGVLNEYNTSSLNNVARLNADGSLDGSFNPGMGANRTIYTTKIQNDGKIFIGGDLTGYFTPVLNRMVRININGSIDPAFSMNFLLGRAVYTSSVQSDGKIIIGGLFNNNNQISRVGRVNTDGSYDGTFSTGFLGVNNTVYSTAIQTDGKILIGGKFTTYDLYLRSRIARLNADGAVDLGFNIGTGANDSIMAIAIQSDGKIIIAGDFTTYNSIARNRIARLNADGTLDATFDLGTGANGIIRTVSIQADGKIIISGGFTNYNATARNRVARLNADGTLDVTFDPGAGADNNIFSTAIQTDGKIIIAGDFLNYNVTARNRLARLNADGSLDVGFNPGTGANNSIRTASIQSDGKIIIAGDFTAYNGTGRNRIARVIASSVPSNDLCSGAVVIPPAGPFPYITTARDNSAATNTGDPAPACQALVNKGVWWSFTPAVSGPYKISTCQSDAPLSSIADNVLAIFTSAAGCAGPFTQVSNGCDDDACTTLFNQAVLNNITLNAGTAYYILVYGYNANTGNAQVYINPLPPANDACSGAVVIPPAGPFPYTTAPINNTYATNTGDPAASCQVSVNKGVWWSFTPASSGPYKISSCQSDAPLSSIPDNVLSIYTSAAGCAGPFTEVAAGCNDDGCTTLSNQGIINSINLTAGTAYYILVYGYTTNTGNAQLYITPATPVNDNASGAIALTLGAGCVGSPYSNQYATAGATEQFPSCTDSKRAPVWFNFFAPASGAVRVTTDFAGGTLADTKVAIFSATNAGDYSTFTILSCDDDGGSVQAARSVLYTTGLLPGNLYYIAVDKYGPGAGGTFCIAADELNQSMLAVTNNCSSGYQNVNSTAAGYPGWLSLLDASSKLVALVKKPSGLAGSSFSLGQNINTGAVRQTGGVFYLDRNFKISSAEVNTDVQLFFLNSELAALTAADPMATLGTLGGSKQADGGGVCADNFVVATGAVTPFGQASNGSAPGVSWITFNTSSFSNFYLHRAGAVLPVTIEYFRGSKLAGANYLDWKVTCTGAPTVTLVLERSSDGRNFISIQDQNVPAARCSQSFNYTDAAPPAGINYYRLKMITPDGKVGYSTIVTLLNKDKGFELISVAPNPVRGSAVLTVTTVKGGRMDISVSDGTGRVVIKQTVTVIAGSNPVNMNVATLGAGTYNITAVNADGEVKTTRFVKF